MSLLIWKGKRRRKDPLEIVEQQVFRSDSGRLTGRQQSSSPLVSSAASHPQGRRVEQHQYQKLGRGIRTRDRDCPRRQTRTAGRCLCQSLRLSGAAAIQHCWCQAQLKPRQSQFQPKVQKKYKHRYPYKQDIGIEAEGKKTAGPGLVQDQGKDFCQSPSPSPSLTPS